MREYTRAFHDVHQVEASSDGVRYGSYNEF